MGWRDLLGAPRPFPRSETKARALAHEAMDSLWQCGAMSRSEAYHWMSRAMGVDVADAHVANLDRDQCIRLRNLAIQMWCIASAIHDANYGAGLCPVCDAELYGPARDAARCTSCKALLDDGDDGI